MLKEEHHDQRNKQGTDFETPCIQGKARLVDSVVSQVDVLGEEENLAGMPTVTLKEVNDKTERALEKLSNEAYDSIDGQQGGMMQAKTETLKDGCMNTTWINLIKKYNTRIIQSRAEKKHQFTQSKLEDWTKIQTNGFTCWKN